MDRAGHEPYKPYMPANLALMFCLQRHPARTGCCCMCLVPCEVGSCPLGRESPLGCHHVTYSSLAMAKQLPRCGSCCVCPIRRGSFSCQLILLPFARFLLLRKKPYMPAKLANRANISRQLQETSGVEAYTARPTTGEAASPWQAMSG